MHDLTSKITTLAAALVMNGLLIGGIAYLFGRELQQPPAAVAEASLSAPGGVLA